MHPVGLGRSPSQAHPCFDGNRALSTRFNLSLANFDGGYVEMQTTDRDASVFS